MMKKGREWDIFHDLEREERDEVRANIIHWVLGTDNVHHAAHLKEYKDVVGAEDFDPKAHKKMIVWALLHGADVSNGTRPIEVSKVWSLNVLEEFFI